MILKNMSIIILISTTFLLFSADQKSELRNNFLKQYKGQIQSSQVINSDVEVLHFKDGTHIELYCDDCYLSDYTTLEYRPVKKRTPKNGKKYKGRAAWSRVSTRKSDYSIYELIKNNPHGLFTLFNKEFYSKNKSSKIYKILGVDDYKSYLEKWTTDYYFCKPKYTTEQEYIAQGEKHLTRLFEYDKWECTFINLESVRWVTPELFVVSKGFSSNIRLTYYRKYKDVLIGAPISIEMDMQTGGFQSLRYYNQPFFNVRDLNFDLSKTIPKDEIIKNLEGSPLHMEGLSYPIRNFYTTTRLSPVMDRREELLVKLDQMVKEKSLYNPFKLQKDQIRMYIVSDRMYKYSGAKKSNYNLLKDKNGDQVARLIMEVPYLSDDVSSRAKWGYSIYVDAYTGEEIYVDDYRRECPVPFFEENPKFKNMKNLDLIKLFGKYRTIPTIEDEILIKMREKGLGKEETNKQ